MRKQTRQIESVETHNIAICLRRTYAQRGPTVRKTKRTLYNAVQMANFMNDLELNKLRIALDLP